MNLAYFAIDKEYQGTGIGRALMMEFFSMCMVIALYTGVQLIYLESVDESVNFYKRLGYELLHKDATPEAYQKFGNDTRNIQFPMLRKISDLIADGHSPYIDNVLPINVEK
ncbi:GNAT family N-acetyltransferase [Lactobacillus crispatus]|uniref:GNAT family N-acetyltransferase n=1 Tax=Lactobacillus crispatus TaxID=47770 RepID=UPI0023EA5606|nr:GNAT family N-acetyltransferase [Lactobacillus crispatus]